MCLPPSTRRKDNVMIPELLVAAQVLLAIYVYVRKLHHG